MAAAAAASGPALSCSGPVQDDAGLTLRLCSALRQAFLAHYGFDLADAGGSDPAAGPVLRLDIAKAAPASLSARLLWSDPATDPTLGPLMELTIMDRDSFPDMVLLNFARDLLVATDLPLLQRPALQP